MKRQAVIRTGVAGWDYPDWKAVLYPSPRPAGFDRVSAHCFPPRFQVGLSSSQVSPVCQVSQVSQVRLSTWPGARVMRSPRSRVFRITSRPTARHIAESPAMPTQRIGWRETSFPPPKAERAS